MKVFKAGPVQDAGSSSIGRSVGQKDQQNCRSFRPVDLRRAIVLRDLIVDGAPGGRVISPGELEADDRGATLVKGGLGPCLRGVNLGHSVGQGAPELVSEEESRRWHMVYENPLAHGASARWSHGNERSMEIRAYGIGSVQASQCREPDRDDR